MKDFKNMTSAELLDIILQGNEQSDEAMYYVLKERVGKRLKERFRTHEHVFFEDFEDVVDVAYVLSCYRPPHEKERPKFPQTIRYGRKPPS